MSTSTPTPSRPQRFPSTRPSLPPPGRAAPATEVKVDQTPSPAAAEVEIPLLEMASFLPDESALQKAVDKGTLQKTETLTRAQALQALHSMSLLAPGVLDALHSSANEEEQVDRFRVWAERVRQMAVEWAQRWPVATEDLPWVIASLERVVATHPRLTQAKQMDLLMDLAMNTSPPPAVPGPALPVAAPLALATALARVQRAQTACPMGRPRPDEDLEAVARLLAEAGQDAIAELVGPTGSQEVRTTVFCSVVEEAGETLAHMWRLMGQAFAARVRERSVAEQHTWEVANPDGVDLDPLFVRFREHGARLRRLASLARPRI